MSPLEMREAPENNGREFGRCLHMGRDQVEATGDTQTEETEEEGSIPTIPTVEEVGVENGEVAEK